ncbi:FAD-binding oxidoreductase [bacterium]|nr:MAG: FAD-binding oxidoreductase [bacterium]
MGGFVSPIFASMPSNDPQGLSRRQFLGTTARWMLATGVVAQLPWLSGCGGGGGEARALPTSAWDDLARGFSGTVLRPGAAGFDLAAQPNNLRYNDRRPLGIARCLTVEDVQKSILWSRQNGLPLVARSGGHSYAGFSTTEGLMIDVSQMNGVGFNEAGQAVTGGGARNRDVFDALANTGMAVTHGRCYGVGVAGLVLGGGIGFDMRKHGLTCDHLVETTMVTASGEILKLSETENKELFWACRGAGGGNYGIHTSFTFEPYAVSTAVAFNLTWETRLEEVLAALLPALEAAPDEFGAKLSVIPARPGTSDKIRINLLGQHFGTVTEFRDILASVYAIAAPSEEVDDLPYWPAQKKLTEEGGPEYYHERSRFVEQSFSEAALDTIWAGVRNWPGTSEGASFKVFQSGGAVNRRSPNDMAFVHRSALYVMSVAVLWSEHDSVDLLRQNLNWQDEFYDAMRPFTGPGAYQNFIDPSLDDWQQAYYGENFSRLVAAKRAVDPDNVFHYAQSIPV